MRIVRTLILSIRTCVAVLLFYSLEPAMKEIVSKDIYRNLKWDKDQGSLVKKLKKLVAIDSFCTVFMYRVNNSNSNIVKLVRLFLGGFIPKSKTIEIDGNIGGGLMVSHNYSVIYPEKAGNNLRVGPGVIIGRNSKGFPQIGDNVYIASNATVIGNIKIGDNVIVGAGSVITKDVPSNCVVVGNPGRILREIEKKDFNEIC